MHRFDSHTTHAACNSRRPSAACMDLCTAWVPMHRTRRFHDCTEMNDVEPFFFFKTQLWFEILSVFSFGGNKEFGGNIGIDFWKFGVC